MVTETPAVTITIYGSSFYLFPVTMELRQKATYMVYIPNNPDNQQPEKIE